MNSRNALIFIFLTIVIDATGIGIIIPTLPNLIADVSNVPVEESKPIYGYVLMTYALAQFVFAPLVGGLSDRFGRKPILLLSLFGLGIDYIFMYFAPTLFWFILGRCIAGAFGASFTTATAYIADISTPEDKTKNFGLVGAAFGMGFIIGPVIGGILGDVGIRTPFLFAAGLSLLNFILGLVVLKESLPLEKRRKFSFKRSNPIGAVVQMTKYKSLGLLFIVSFLFYLAGTAIQVTWVYLTEEKFDWTKTNIGISLAVVGICIALVQGGLAGWFTKRFGNVRTAYFGLITFVFALVGIGMATHGWMLYALMLPYALTGLAGPTIQAIMSNSTADDQQGELQGSVTSIISISEVVGPLIMAYLLELTTTKSYATAPIYGTPYFFAALLGVVALILFWSAMRKTPNA